MYPRLYPPKEGGVDLTELEILRFILDRWQASGHRPITALSCSRPFFINDNSDTTSFFPPLTPTRRHRRIFFFLSRGNEGPCYFFFSFSVFRRGSPL